MEIKAKDIQLVDISSLKENPKNRNKHSKEQIERLIKLIEYQGFRNPIVVSNRTGLMVAGHGRLAAAKKLKIKKVPVIYQDFEDETQEQAYLISDNAIASWAELDLSGVNVDIQDMGPDFNIDLLGIKGFEIDVADKELGDEEDTPGLPIESKVVRSDIFILGDHRLMCGDSTVIDDVEKLMDGQKADMWIADPPFGVSYMEKNAAVSGGKVKNQEGKEIKSDTKSVEELCPLWKDTALNAYIVTTDKATNYWCACQGSDKMMMMMDEAGWNIRHELIWAKDAFVLGRSDYHYRHEPIIYGWKKNGTHEWYGDRKQDSVIEIPRPKKSDLHPTSKPVELFEKFISNSTKSGDLIFESFGGSGTTLIAAEKLNRKSNTMELDAHYCSVILDRWEKYTGREAHRLNPDGSKTLWKDIKNG